MHEDQEPFFTPVEWKTLVLFRPLEWWQWWRAEPLLTKGVVALGALAAGSSVFELMRGNKAASFVLIYVPGLLLATLILVALGGVIIASFRWLFRVSGLRTWWRRVRERAWAVFWAVFWTGFAGLIVFTIWPYLSLSPARSWYGLRHEVPAERVEIVKKPHDCEFTSAPIGSKHCHYDAKVILVPDTDSRDGRRSLIVTYERVED